MGRGKKASFNYIKERVWRKLQDWDGKLLSQAGREVLIKAVIQAIPTFAMGVLSSLWAFVMRSKLWSRSFGGGSVEIEEKSIKCGGMFLPNQNW